MGKSLTVAQRPSALFEDLTAHIESIKDKRFIIKKAEAGHAIAKRCAADICEGKEDEKEARRAVVHFIAELFPMLHVPAVAFHSSRFVDCPATLTVTILHTIEPPTGGSSPEMKAIASAFKVLASELKAIAPTAIRYVYAVGMELRALESELRADWSRDPLIHLLGFGEFRREVS